MNSIIKNYIKFAKTLSFDQLVEEGLNCSVKLVGTVMDLNTGVIKSYDLFAEKMGAITLALCQTAYNDLILSDKELEFISKTISIPADELENMIIELRPSTLFEASNNQVGVINQIRSVFTSKDELLILAKYIILVSLADGRITLAEKMFADFIY